jgi:hypothetical protein
MNARRAKSTERDEHLESDAREASASPEPALRREFGDVLSLQRTIGNRRTAALMVQRIKLQDMRERSARMHEMAKTAPEKGVNLWRATHESGGSVHLLGTHHYHQIGAVGDRASRQYLVDFLASGNFTEIYTEMPLDVLKVEVRPNLLDEVDEYATKVLALAQAQLGGNRIAIHKANVALSDAKGTPLGKFASAATDDAYLSLAAITGKPTIGAFESNTTKLAAHEQNVADLEIPEGDPEHRLSNPGADTSGPDPGFMGGNQKQLFIDAANELGAGRDVANAEERNRQFMEIFKLDLAKSKEVRQLWIIGAAHLPGLILRFQDIGWNVEHQAPPAPKTEVTEEEPEKTPVGVVASTGADEVD